ncbi:hypothetical protein C3L33_04167, partial [Rhododendron williamsianum]
MKPINKALAILALLFLLSMFKPHEAARVLSEKNLSLQTLRGDVPPSKPDGGTYTPRTSTLGQKGFAGQAMPPPPPLPQLMVPVGVATS